MSQKYLHELLKEDQEPFLLNNYISHKRNQIKNTTTTLQLNKKPINHIQTSNFNLNLCKNSCFFSKTQDFTNSPLFEFTSPCKSPNPIFLHNIPSRTASLLLEAALRIHKHSSSSSSNRKTRVKGFGLFGSLFKKLTQRNQNRKLEIVNANVLNFSSVVRREEKIETSSSGYSFFLDHDGSSCYHREFSESPFRFVLQTSPCSGSHTPELASPSGNSIKDKESKEGESLIQLKSGEEEDEDKEQCSPVCVLDPPFEDDDEGHINDDDDDEEDGGDFDLESSYAIVQRARKQILYKLRRFEKLAELDPLELEKRMIDQEEDEDETYMEEDDDVENDEKEVSCKENDFKELVFEAVYLSMVHNRRKIPQEFKKLIFDLIAEEEREYNTLEDRDMVITRICKRMESWKEVESNTINMMIEEDLIVEDGRWKKNVEHVRNMARELELAIFSILVQEFSEELLLC